MIKKIEEYDKYITIAGFRDTHINPDNVLKLIRKEFDIVAVQLFDAKKIAGQDHLFFAALNALKAFRNGTNISRNLAVECLLYAASHRQITVALSNIGIKEDSSQIAVVVIADSRKVAEDSLEKVSRVVSGERDDRVLDLTDEKVSLVRHLFNISDEELSTKIVDNGEKKALLDLVLEHMALLVTRK